MNVSIFRQLKEKDIIPLIKSAPIHRTKSRFLSPLTWNAIGDILHHIKVRSQ